MQSRSSLETQSNNRFADWASIYRPQPYYQAASKTEPPRYRTNAFADDVQYLQPDPTSDFEAETVGPPQGLSVHSSNPLQLNSSWNASAPGDHSPQPTRPATGLSRVDAYAHPTLSESDEASDVNWSTLPSRKKARMDDGGAKVSQPGSGKPKSMKQSGRFTLPFALPSKAVEQSQEPGKPRVIVYLPPPPPDKPSSRSSSTPKETWLHNSGSGSASTTDRASMSSKGLPKGSVKHPAAWSIKRAGHAPFVDKVKNETEDEGDMLYGFSGPEDFRSRLPKREPDDREILYNRYQTPLSDRDRDRVRDRDGDTVMSFPTTSRMNSLYPETRHAMLQVRLLSLFCFFFSFSLGLGECEADFGLLCSQ